MKFKKIVKHLMLAQLLLALQAHAGKGIDTRSFEGAKKRVEVYMRGLNSGQTKYNEKEAGTKIQEMQNLYDNPSLSATQRADLASFRKSFNTQYPNAVKILKAEKVKRESGGEEELQSSSLLLPIEESESLTSLAQKALERAKQLKPETFNTEQDGLMLNYLMADLDKVLASTQSPNGAPFILRSVYTYMNKYFDSVYKRLLKELPSMGDDKFKLTNRFVTNTIEWENRVAQLVDKTLLEAEKVSYKEQRDALNALATPAAATPTISGTISAAAPKTKEKEETAATASTPSALPTKVKQKPTVAEEPTTPATAQPTIPETVTKAAEEPAAATPADRANKNLVQAGEFLDYNKPFDQTTFDQAIQLINEAIIIARKDAKGITPTGSVTFRIATVIKNLAGRIAETKDKQLKLLFDNNVQKSSDTLEALFSTFKDLAKYADEDRKMIADAKAKVAQAFAQPATLPAPTTPQQPTATSTETAAATPVKGADVSGGGSVDVKYATETKPATADKAKADMLAALKDAMTFHKGTIEFGVSSEYFGANASREWYGKGGLQDQVYKFRRILQDDAALQAYINSVAGRLFFLDVIDKLNELDVAVRRAIQEAEKKGPFSTGYFDEYKRRIIWWNDRVVDGLKELLANKTPIVQRLSSKDQVLQ